MAMIKCKECGKEISDKASSCPHCGYVYKKNMTTMKVVFIVILVFIIGLVLLGLGTYIIFDFIPSNRTKINIKKYYGTYELVEADYDNMVKMYPIKYNLKKEIIINTENVESYGGESCTFGTPEKDFAITNYHNNGCTKDYYLISSLEAFADPLENPSAEDLYYLEETVICFKKDKDMLIQIDCAIDDNTTNKNVGIKYKLK